MDAGVPLVLWPGVLLGLVFFCGLAWLGGRVVLGRLPEADRNARRPVQFLLSDTYLLLAELALAGLVAFGAFSGGDTEARLVLMLVLWFFLALFWYLGVRRLSQRGAARAGRRAAFLVLAAPVAFGALLLPLFMFIALLGFKRSAPPPTPAVAVASPFSKPTPGLPGPATPLEEVDPEEAERERMETEKEQRAAETARKEFERQREQDARMAQLALFAALGYLGFFLFMAFFGCRALERWTVGDGQDEEPTQVPQEAG